MSVRVDNSVRPPLRLILGDASATTTRSTSTSSPVCRDRLVTAPERRIAADSARALLALAPHATNRRYWLIDPIPALREIAAGAPLTRGRLRQLDLARDALAAQLREDDSAGHVLLAALRRHLQGGEEKVVATVAALHSLGDSASSRLLVEELRGTEPFHSAPLTHLKAADRAARISGSVPGIGRV
jgi:hypothetical protein